MKGNIFATIAITSLSVRAASIPSQNGKVFKDTNFVAVREHFTSESVDIMARGAGVGIEICTDQYWSGTCGYKVQPFGVCIRLDPPWWHSISSFGPDPGAVCTWYSDYDCQNIIAEGIVCPGIDDMDTPNGCDKTRRGEELTKRCHGNQMGSFQCWAT